MEFKEMFKAEVEHRQQNFKSFGYDIKPNKNLIELHLLSLTNLKEILEDLYN